MWCQPLFRKGYYSAPGSSASQWPGFETLSRSHTGTCFHRMACLWGKNKWDEKIFLSLDLCFFFFTFPNLTLSLTLSLLIFPCKSPYLSLPVENVVDVGWIQSGVHVIAEQKRLMSYVTWRIAQCCCLKQCIELLESVIIIAAAGGSDAQFSWKKVFYWSFFWQTASSGSVRYLYISWTWASV